MSAVQTTIHRFFFLISYFVNSTPILCCRKFLVHFLCWLSAWQMEKISLGSDSSTESNKIVVEKPLNGLHAKTNCENNPVMERSGEISQEPANSKSESNGSNQPRFSNGIQNKSLNTMNDAGELIFFLRW